MNFEQVIDTASALGYSCVELACWPQEQASRRYAGVSHLNVAELDDALVAHVKEYCAAKGVEISSLAYYPNNLDEDLEHRSYFHDHLRKVIDASAKLGINMVTTFVGRMQTKTIEENFAEFAKVWPPIIKFAEERGVKIAIDGASHPQDTAIAGRGSGRPAAPTLGGTLCRGRCAAQYTPGISRQVWRT